jgi:hypothetical protein
MMPWLDNRRLPNGGWEWPPIGAIGEPGLVSAFRMADPDEAAAYESLERMLRNRGSDSFNEHE